jgi:hypothetical protein
MKRHENWRAMEAFDEWERDWDAYQEMREREDSKVQGVPERVYDKFLTNSGEKGDCE